MHSTCIIVFVVFFPTIEQAKRFQFYGKMFSIGFQNCVLSVQQSNWRRNSLFRRSFYILFFRTLKEGSVFCENYSRRESQFCVLPNHWDNSRKVFLLIEKVFFISLFLVLREMFLAVRHKKLRGFHYCMLRVHKKFWWKQFQWKKSYCFLASWTLSSFFWLSGIKFSASLSKLHFKCPLEHFE